MKKLREMRNPLKYVQGRDALLSFCKETGYMGKNYLFVCSHSAYEACHDKLEKSFEGTDKVRGAVETAFLRNLFHRFL